MSLAQSIKRASDDASTFVKLKSGDTVRMHIITPLTEAKVFMSLNFDTPPYEGAPKVMNLPAGTQLPGYKLRTQWAFEVVDVETGKHRILQCSQGVVEDILATDVAFRPKDKKDVEGSGQHLYDITLSRKGEKLLTKWTVSGGPTQYEGDGVPILDLDSEFKMATAEQLERLPAVTPIKNKGAGINAKMTKAQANFINTLSKQHELTTEALSKLAASKFGKPDLDELTGSEASVLIQTLQTM
jgi:hypothetical protein